MVRIVRRVVIAFCLCALAAAFVPEVQAQSSYNSYGYNSHASQMVRDRIN